MKDALKKLNEKYDNWKWEAETFFITKFVDSKTIQETFKNCLDIVFNISGLVDVNRGIVAHNQAYGQGKTFFFNVLNHRYKRKTGKDFFVNTSSKALVKIFKEHGEDALLEFITCKNLFIDDLGDEGQTKIFKHYSNEMNVLRYVVLKRYEFWDEHNWRTFITTNLSIGQIAKEYGGRAADRLKQMCHMVSFGFLGGGKSFRQYSGTRKLTAEEIKLRWKCVDDVMSQIIKEKVDVISYLNEMLKEDDLYLAINDFSRWSFIKPYMLERNLIDIDNIDDETWKAAEMLAIYDAGSSVRGKLKHAGEAIVAVKAKKARDGVKTSKVNYIAECIVTKKAFIELKEKNYVFE